VATLLTDRRLSPELAEWAAARIEHVGSAGFGPCWACGVALQGKLAAVVVWHDYYPAFGTLQLSIASVNPRWANRHTFGRVLALAFDQPWGVQATQIEKVWSRDAVIQCARARRSTPPSASSARLCLDITSGAATTQSSHR
jgi:hypothetical protein